MTRMLALAAMAAAVLVAVGCDSSGGDIFPMSVGSSWHMDITITSSGTAASLDTSGTGTVVYTMADKANLTAGPEVVRYEGVETVHSLTPDSTFTDTFHSYYRDEGDWILGYSTLDDTAPDTVMVTTPSVGMTWHSGTLLTEVVGQEDVSVPAKTYRKAWKIKSSSNQGGFDTQTFSWYAPGTGLVKTRYELSYQGYSMVAEEVLTSATIK